MRESWVKCYAKYHGDAIKAAERDGRALSLSPFHCFLVVRPYRAHRGLPAAAAGAPCTQESEICSSTDACAQHALQIDREQRDNSAKEVSERVNSGAWKRTTTAAVAGPALTLAATVSTLLKCAKAFVYFCLAADTKKKHTNVQQK